MQLPIFATVCDRAQGATRGLAGDALILSLAGALIAAGCVFLPRLAPPAAPPQAQPAFARDRDGGETVDEFLERVARTHVASLTAPPASAAPAAPAQRPANAPRPGATRAGKARPADAANAQQPAGAAPPAVALASAPALGSAPAEPAKFDWLAPVHYSMQLAADAGKFVAASNERVVQTLASAGSALTSFGRK